MLGLWVAWLGINMNKLSNFNKGLLSGFGAVMCFSVITTFGVKVYQSGISPLSLLTSRMFIAGILIFLTILLSRKISFKIEKKDWLIVSIYSLLLAIHLILFWEGTKILTHIPTIYACYFTYPFWAIIIACLFLKEKITKVRVVSLALGTIGTLFAIRFLPSMSIGDVNLTGVGLVLIAALIWGINILIGQRIFKKYSFITVLFYSFLISFLFFIYLQSPSVTISQINISSLFYLLIIGVISTYLAYILFSKAIKHFGGVNWGLTNLSSPLFNGLAAFIFLGQIVNYYQALGITLSTFGVYLLYKGKK